MMTNMMHLETNEIHIWSTELFATPEEESERFSWLTEDEKERAKRFHFPVHQRRFIMARSTLRQILSLYLDTDPKDIRFAYGEHRKPHLIMPDDHFLQFNLAHSNDIAIYAITQKHAVGIDIEKEQDTFNEPVANRYFSDEENAELRELPALQRLKGFYRLWARKEALIKAVGKGLAIPLSDFSVSLTDEPQLVKLERKNWRLIPLSISEGYQAALAANENCKKISFWKFSGQEPQQDNVYQL